MKPFSRTDSQNSMYYEEDDVFREDEIISWNPGNRRNATLAEDVSEKVAFGASYYDDDDSPRRRSSVAIPYMGRKGGRRSGFHLGAALMPKTWLLRMRNKLRRGRRRPSSVERENNLLMRLLTDQTDNSEDEYEAANSEFREFFGLQDTNSSTSVSSFHLEEHIKLHHLQKLLEVFRAHVPRHLLEDDNPVPLYRRAKKNDDDAIKPSPGMMTLQEFKSAISSMLGSSKFDEQMEKLFYKVDTACDGFVDWDELCTYMLLRMRELEHLHNATLRPFSTPAVIRQIFHNKQETTTRTLVLSSPLRVLTISKLGAIGVWSNDLKLIKTYNLANDVADDQQLPKRRFHTWVTDAVYMRNTQNLALSTSSREIYFYDVSTSIYSIEYCLYAIPNVPICTFYHYQPGVRNGSSILFFGDDTGSAHLLKFTSPSSRLFQKPFAPQQGTQRIYFNDLREHRNFVTYERIDNIHDEALNRIMYVQESDVIITSSLSPTTSVVMMDLKKKKKPYIFKVSKGVECFDYSKPLNILVTGSLDHLVRIWNPYVVARPIRILRGHNTGICDVMINESHRQIISYSKEVVIKVWDVKEHNCLQTISPKFPSVQTGRIPDHGEFPLCLYQSSSTDLLILNCNDCIALYKLGKLLPEAELPTTHSAPLSGLAYNPLFHQVATTSDDSCVSIWDIETGSRSIMFNNCHGNEEITCVSFDNKNRRLFTGARDGSVKIWNFQNGNCLHELEAVDDAEVTGVASFHENTIISVGWSRKIVIYDDSDPDLMKKKAMLNWKGGQIHHDDILSLAITKSPNLIATGSYDGKLVVWNDETQQVFIQLRSEHSNKQASGENRSIDVLHFLTERLRHQPSGRAVLLSCESGIIYWWCLYGKVGSLGNFKASDRDAVSVLSLSTTHDDHYLITGDTSGHVTVWNIEDYCVTDRQGVTTERPPIAYEWRAHDGAIIKVEFIEHEYQSLVVTASTDKTARMWTLEGHLVGTFGQRKKWDLKKPKTFCHPLDPWGERIVGEEEQEEAKEEVKKDAVDEELPKAASEKDEDESYTSDDYSDSSSDHDVTPPRPSTPPQSAPLPPLTDQDFDILEEDDQTPKRILGSTAEETLTRRTTARQERRNRVGYIDNKVTARFGNICSPFQALTIRETEAVTFEQSMPMTRRMTEKGMKCKNETDLSKLPLSHLSDFNQGENNENSRGTTVQRKRLQAGTRRHVLATSRPPMSSQSHSSMTSTPRPLTGEVSSDVTTTRRRGDESSTPISGYL